MTATNTMQVLLLLLAATAVAATMAAATWNPGTEVCSWPGGSAACAGGRPCCSTFNGYSVCAQRVGECCKYFPGVACPKVSTMNKYKEEQEEEDKEEEEEEEEGEEIRIFRKTTAVRKVFVRRTTASMCNATETGSLSARSSFCSNDVLGWLSPQYCILFSFFFLCFSFFSIHLCLLDSAGHHLRGAAHMLAPVQHHVVGPEFL